MHKDTILCFDEAKVQDYLQNHPLHHPSPGTIYTRLTFNGNFAIRDFISDQGKRWITLYMQCVCQCGKVDYYQELKLRRGDTRSCGCLGRDITSARKKAEPLKYRQNTADYPLFFLWNGMRDRCQRPTNTSFKKYGAKGITVCDEWQDFKVFEDWAFENGYELGLTIDRRDGTIGYCPENCRWADYATQNRNTTRNVHITIHGETKCLVDWLNDARTACTDSSTYLFRVRKKGLTPYEALMAEKQSGGCKPKPFTFKEWPID